MATLSQVQVEYLATAEGLQDAANAAAVEYIGLEQGAAAALIDESGNLIHSARNVLDSAVQGIAVIGCVSNFLSTLGPRLILNIV